MSSLSGILSLHDAFHTETMAFPSINPKQLELGAIEESSVKTYFRSYYQPILYGGMKLVLQAPSVEISSLTYHKYSAGDAVLMPISKWLRQQFNIIDDFVRDNVTIPDKLLAKWPYNNFSYKRIFEGDSIYLIMDKSCRITQDTDDGIIELSSAARPQLNEGYCSITIEFPHVYIGWHHNHHLYSTNFRITHVHFKPKSLCSDSGRANGVSDGPTSTLTTNDNAL